MKILKNIKINKSQKQMNKNTKNYTQQKVYKKTIRQEISKEKNRKTILYHHPITASNTNFFTKPPP